MNLAPSFIIFGVQKNFLRIYKPMSISKGFNQIYLNLKPNIDSSLEFKPWSNSSKFHV
jgi:hypothetical protein